MPGTAFVSFVATHFAAAADGEPSVPGYVVLVLLVVICLSVLIPTLKQILQLWCEWRSEQSSAFGAFVQYRFGYWVSWNPSAQITILATVLGTIFPIGAVVYMLANRTSIQDGAWKTFLFLVAPDGGAEEEALWGAFVGGILSLLGLLVFALLLTFIQDGFHTYLENLKEGVGPVLESEHVVVLGLTKASLHLLEELSMAFEHQGGVPIVVLTETKTKPEFEADVKDMGIELGRSRLVIRQGHPQYRTDLMRVAVHSCRSVIIMADRSKDKEVRDAYALQAMMVMLSQGWPVKGRILVEVSLLRMRPIIERLGGPHVDIVMTERWMAKLFVQVSMLAGLGGVLNQVLSFKDSRLTIQKVPAFLDGKSYEEAVLHYPSAIVLGVLLENKECRFGPGKQGQRNPPLRAGQDLVMIVSKQLHSEVAQLRPCSAPQSLQLEHKSPPPRVALATQEKILIVGWGDNIGPLLVELHKVIRDTVKVVTLSPLPVEDRESRLARTQRRWQTVFEKFEFEHVAGMLGSPTALDRVGDLEAFTRIFILADITTLDARHADACTIAAVVHIREVLASKKVGKRVPIIPEIVDPRSERLCSICKVADFIDASGLPVEMLTAVTFLPDLRLVLRGMLSEDQAGSVHFSIHPLSDYAMGETLPSQVSFWQVQALVGRTGDAVVGWTKPREAGEAEMTQFGKEMTAVVFEAHGKDEIFHQYELNPDSKERQRVWHPSDKVVVVRHD